jgi:hypothetical protein
MSKQTAVEWLQERLLLSLSDELKSLNGFFVIAKEMEKEQIIDAHYIRRLFPIIMKTYKGLSVDEINVELKKQAEQYYNETYKKEIK